MTRAPEGIIGASPRPTKARQTTNETNETVALHNAVAIDHTATAAG
jgi:hypothetical protein